MAISDKFNGSKTSLLYETPFTADVSAMVEADVASFTVVEKIMELGSISNEANVIDVPEFGQDYAGKLVGQLNAGTIDMTVAWNPGAASHIALKSAVTNKTKLTFVIKWDDGGGVNFEYVAFNGYVSSFGIETSIDDAVKASLSIAIDGELAFFNA